MKKEAWLHKGNKSKQQRNDVTTNLFFDFNNCVFMLQRGAFSDWLFIILSKVMRVASVTFCYPTLQMFAGIYRDFAGKSECWDFQFLK